MQKLKKTMKKIGQFTYYFSDMDTVILDKDSDCHVGIRAKSITGSLTAIYECVARPFETRSGRVMIMMSCFIQMH